MSDFAPGLASRHAGTGEALKRAFVPPAASGSGFAAIDPKRFGTRGFRPEASAPRHFAPADPTTNPTAGWDPFDAAAAQQGGVTKRHADPNAAFDAGVAEGRRLALAELEAAGKREAALLDQISVALAQGAHFDRERMAGQLRQTVLHLVTRLVGEVGVAPDVLNARIAAAVEHLADDAESALLRMHPEDLPAVEGRLSANVFAVGDPNLKRGAFAIESASTIVEDGPELWLEQLAEAIDRVPVPPPC